ncbi:MAG: UDP-N-acetylglucosamine 1-carboxyvinyltransferase [Bacteroidetes bacterium]|nr:UDP-N-acetylglucosamine 1-carboxyvinyltransferase [Bacteroidota bacterium]MCH7772169.1 UDP-N-acetylglucosamine 1-carboxyvinyltransferase [Bacteroidota bacterium]
MDKFIIKGGITLKGELGVSGAKNASLALLPATILAPGRSTLKNTPELNDVFTMIKLLRHIGAVVEFKDHVLSIETGSITNQIAPYEHVKKMRASVYVLGPLLTRYGRAKVSLPGGCAWGPRPINLHLEALKKMGANIDLVDGYIVCDTNRLRGENIKFDISSVGATGNILMASVLAKGTTKIQNAATEPEITNLAKFLVKMGAKIEGIGTNILTIDGVDDLIPVEIDTIADRIEAGTLLIAAAITNGSIILNDVDPGLLSAILLKLMSAGCKIKTSENKIELDASELEIKNINVSTSIFPGFPTDMQAQWTAFMSLANGKSLVRDTIYFDRFKHVPELVRLGANISVNDNTALVKGVKELKGAKVMSTDLRASASLLLAGLAARGTTEILRVYHLDRGYQRIEEKLRNLGADIERVVGKEF